MTAPATPYIFPQQTQDKLIEWCKKTFISSYQTMDLRSRFASIDKEYIRENTLANVEAAKLDAAVTLGDKRKIRDIVIPIVEPQCETALAYLTSVFLTGQPIFGVVSDKNNINQAKQIEAVISENSIRGSWATELMLFFRDGLKYNFHAVEVDWCTEKIYSVETDAKFSSTQGKPKEIVWQGNKVKRVDPYNCIFDPRIELTKQHKEAEFVGYCELKNRVSLVSFIQSLPTRMNVTKAYSSTIPSGAMASPLYFIPQIFTANLTLSNLLGMQNWDSWATGRVGKDGQPMDFKGLYILVTRYVRIIPSDFDINVPARNQVQIWKLITVNDQVLVYAERLTNAHNYLPIIFGQPIRDGLNLQTKSYAQKQIPMQDIGSALANSRFAARRRLISDRGLFDPSRVREADINSDNPSAKIPVRPSAYGQPLDKAYYPIPFRDEQTGTLMQDVREVQRFSDYLSGQNPAQQGQFVKGNRTQSEYDDVQNKSSGRQQTMALSIEGDTFTPLKEILKTNILQYQPAGEVYSYVDQKPYNVNPIDLRKSIVMFKVSDGLVPADKLINSDDLKVAFQVMAQAPQIAEEYNLGDVFNYLMKTRGVNLDDFKYTPQQKQAQQAQNTQNIEAETAAQARQEELAKHLAPQQPPQGQ
jgi:hypothetical protein